MKQETGGPGPNFKVARRPRRVRELRPGHEGSGVMQRSCCVGKGQSESRIFLGTVQQFRASVDRLNTFPNQP